ncbi:MAG: hypothetical protein Q4G65_10390 [bacterium]|nr:hypothetical protein [bacterium]
MNYRNARLANGFLSLDQLAGEIDLVKSRIVSDGGKGVERIVRMIDCSDCSTDGEPRWLAEEREAARERQRKIDAARQKLRRAGIGYLTETFLLICKNGKNRDESIRELAMRQRLPFESAERLYFGHRKKIENFFLGQ